MTVLVKHAPGKPRAVHKSWAGAIDSKPMFRHVVTLDPVLADDAWDRLCTYTPAIEFQELPVRLHGNLLRAMKNMRLKRQ